MKRIRISCCSGGGVALYAAQELKKYLRMMMPDLGDVELCDPPRPDSIGVGLFEAFGLTPDGIDRRMDDALHIEVADMRGVIAGSNPRSVLAAVYRYLHENGCRWPRPGVDGEVIPLREPCDVSYRHVASYRHRGLCIEGAVSYQNMMDNIEWAPKVGYNAYMLEFKTPFTFFNCWYTHRNNVVKAPEKITLEDVRQHCAWLETEIQKRGMEYHAVGHAWTCEPFGISGLGWDNAEQQLDDETRLLLAEIGGVRGLFHGIPLNTNLCYSNPAARKKIVDYCADYAERNSQIDFLHIWLADATNNHCECEKCREHIPSDFYVLLLNEIDAEFTRRGIPTRLVFLIYVDLLWPPKTFRLANPDRFSLLFAPITRSYSEPYQVEPFQGELPEYRRNDLTFPKDVKENIAYLRAWQKLFSGDSFAYEYYFWRDCYFDPGHYEIARTILEDVKRLNGIGIHGIVSDQTQRSFLPTGFPMYVMGQALYDRELCFDAVADEFFCHCYGEDGALCRDYMRTLSELFDPVYMRGERRTGDGVRPAGYVDEEAARRIEQVRPAIEAFRPVIERNISAPCRGISQSWRLLQFHAELTCMLADACVARAKGNGTEALALWKRTVQYASEQEDSVQDAFDVYSFVNALRPGFSV